MVIDKPNIFGYDKDIVLYVTGVEKEEYIPTGRQREPFMGWETVSD